MQIYTRGYMLANLLRPSAQMANNEKLGLCDPMKRSSTSKICCFQKDTPIQESQSTQRTTTHV